MSQADDSDPIDEAIHQLQRAGWSIGDTAFTTSAGVVAWVASGTNGQAVIRAPRVKPGELPGSISVIPSPDDPLPVGIASEVGRIGGHDRSADRDLGPAEAVWSLVVGREEVESRFALRGGVFVELAEEAQ